MMKRPFLYGCGYSFDDMKNHETLIEKAAICFRVHHKELSDAYSVSNATTISSSKHLKVKLFMMKRRTVSSLCCS